MTAAQSKLYSDDVSLIVVLLDTNPFFWAASTSGNLPFSNFLNQVIPFLNSLLLLNQHNQVVLIATGVNSCDYIYDSAEAGGRNSIDAANVAAISSTILNRLENFVTKDARLAKGSDKAAAGGNGISSLLSGSLSIALCYIQRVFRSGARHPEPRILCLQGSPDGPEQYVRNCSICNVDDLFDFKYVVVNLQICSSNECNIFSSALYGICLLLFDEILSAHRHGPCPPCCTIPTRYRHSATPASYITGGVYLKPQHLDGLFQYLAAVFASDLQSRSFLRLPKPVGVDFRASCFCHKKTIDMGYVCSVCLSIFCKHQKMCSTCGSDLNQSPPDSTRVSRS
ncbi:RNA polymerase II transcription factor B subunit 4 isoform X1 [Ananas comosus]|uniref:General transcription and DNA repair factor IIH subunit TFB4 n=1 Tax=Ananas comosus TaxID=4615 RepID=A0A6P5FF08_ANACO|nr:RNA polymerase II transcription factor B subunit 4 isoform X1 [Ananas comosus]